MTNNNGYIEFKCIELEQPIGTFYIGKMSYQDLISITKADVRRIEERDVEKFSGIQRPLSKKRVKELRKYVNLIDATFPTSIILAIPTWVKMNNNSNNDEFSSSKLIEFDQDRMIMRVRNIPDIAKIIDGQHRIAGLEGFNNGNFELNVTIFVDMDLENQALVFSTINLAQTKVIKSLAYDLLDYATHRSPQKTCHDIARLLNKKDESPFKGKIKILGRATEEGRETLTQAAFIDRLLPYISKDPMSDSDIIKRGKKPKKADVIELAEQPFRNMFIEDRDEVILRIIWNYFMAISRRWPGSWLEPTAGKILNRTTGFSALMRFLRPCYLFVDKGEFNVVDVGAFANIFRQIDLNDEDFTPSNYQPGTSGQTKLFRELIEKTGIPTSNIGHLQN